MSERFVELIHEYQSAVLKAALLFEKYKGVSQNDLSRARFEGLPTDGFLDPEQTIEYYFHGVGCCVIYPNKRVDWDFGNNGRLDGFDAWRLWIFAKEGTDNFPEFQQQEAVNKAFQEAEIKRIIHKQNRVNENNLYYLSAAQ